MPRGTQSMSQSQGQGRLDKKDKDAASSNMVFYILSREKGRPIHKRADLMKAVNLNGKHRLDQEEVLDRTKNSLEDVFGYQLIPLDEMEEDADDTRGAYKNTFMLVNSLAHAVNEASGSFVPTGSVVKNKEGDPIVAEMAHDRAKTSLLYSLLSMIFMSPGSVVRDDTMNNFLIRMGLMPDYNREGGAGQSGEIETRLKKTFGVTDITALIRDEFYKKQHYIHILETDGIEEGVKQHEYRWGIRANIEVRKAQILKNVAAMYECQPSDFKEQYERVKESNEPADNLGGESDADGEGEEPMEAD